MMNQWLEDFYSNNIIENKKIILAGIVGSRAYGLDTPTSDIDVLGIYAIETRRIFGLGGHKDTFSMSDPDVTLHEAAKYCKLAMACNPTVLELMWLPQHRGNQLGLELISIRENFLSADRVRNAYLGYATQQFNKLKSRNDGSFSSDTRKRTSKHARHLLRLLIQAEELYKHCTLTLRLSDPEEVRAFGEKVAEGDLDIAEKRLIQAENLFNNHSSDLPKKPNVEEIDRWLYKVRLQYWEK